MLNPAAIKLTMKTTGKNRHVIECYPKLPGYLYSFQLFKENELFEQSLFTERNIAVFWPTDPGEYHFRVIIKNKEQTERIQADHQSFRFDGIFSDIKLPETEKKKTPLYQNIINVLSEIWQNSKRMLRISIYDFRVQNRDSYLGWFWSILNPLIQIGTFWFVFGIGMRGGAPVEGIPYIVWMLCGLIPWFYLNAGIVKGTGAVYSKAGLVLRLRYPISTLPVGGILTCLYDHIILVGIMVVMFVFMGVFPNLFWLNLLYYEIYAFCFLAALAFLTSTLTMIARDFQKLINALIRLLFYITPILWTTDSIPPTFQHILRLNPLLYIIDGFRDSMLYGVNFWEHKQYIVFFWPVVFVLFLVGATMQQRHRDNYLDML